MYTALMPKWNFRCRNIIPLIFGESLGLFKAIGQKWAAREPVMLSMPVPLRSRTETPMARVQDYQCGSAPVLGGPTKIVVPLVSIENLPTMETPPKNTHTHPYITPSGS